MKSNGCEFESWLALDISWMLLTFIALKIDWFMKDQIEKKGNKHKEKGKKKRNVLHLIGQTNTYTYIRVYSERESI